MGGYWGGLAIFCDFKDLLAEGFDFLGTIAERARVECGLGVDGDVHDGDRRVIEDVGKYLRGIVDF